MAERTPEPRVDLVRWTSECDTETVDARVPHSHALAIITREVKRHGSTDLDMVSCETGRLISWVVR